jgi:hypothetical protein
MLPNFPEDHELLAFFGMEPKVRDPDYPWFYNTLEFEVERQGFLVQCRLSPSYGDVSVRLQQGELELVRLHLQSFKSLSLVTKAEGEILIATFDRGQGDETFSLMLRPHVWVGLGPFQRIPPGPWPPVDDIIRG